MMTDMFLQIDNSKAGKYAFALTGRGLPRYTRSPRVSLRLPWAMRSLGFQPVAPDNPIVTDFSTPSAPLLPPPLPPFLSARI